MFIKLYPVSQRSKPHIRLTVHIALRDDFTQAPILVTLNPPQGFPTYLKKPTLDLAISHLICSVIMTGVLFLQAGKWWADGEDRGWKVSKPVSKAKKS